jgi:prepilin-type N-terminal cleavage/methylation domain-containing protein
MKRRQGFTLVELLVAMALIIFMMAILSGAFQAALGTFRNLKAQGDLAEKLRATAQILQRDLAANHFDGNRRLSDPTFWNNGPPQQGFFQIWHSSTGAPEGLDLDGIGSYRSIDHKLAFTVKLVGNDMGDFFSASAAGSGNVWTPPIPPATTGTPVVPQLPGGLGIGAIQTFGPPESRYQPPVGVASVTGYNYQWAAVAWFLQPQMNPTTGQQDTTVVDPATGSQPVPLYTLYRRQCLLVPDNNLVALATTPIGGVPGNLISNFLEMSCLPDPNTGTTIFFNNPTDITMWANRSSSGWGGQTIYTSIPATSSLYGSDIVLNDVVSFDVRVLPLYPVGVIPPVDPFVTLWDPFFNNFTYTDPTGGNGTVRVFDTWSSFSNGQQNYSTWNTPGTAGTSIPFWTATPLTYVYPVGSGQQITVTGSGPIIRAIQVTIRIWDFKTNQTRQVTIVQAM